ncbi:MAG: hypothetical protein L0Y44_08100 [Phycisphaerales bacterium]|nr:hypothetical protein [Phycisphaerales bacterium]MCI0675967.1 hypothetical protein [Phycisphaerales bacterium]
MRILIGMVIAAAAVLMSGCYTPGAVLFASAGGPKTYYSTEKMQKTLTLIDVRNGEVVFAVDVPAGKQLVIDFDEGEGDDPVERPDLLKYEIMEQGVTTGKLGSAMSVPNAACRRLEVSLHAGVQYAEAPPQRLLRTDELADRPDWWTPQGGPLPEDKTVEMYDD